MKSSTYPIYTGLCIYKGTNQVDGTHLLWTLTSLHINSLKTIAMGLYLLPLLLFVTGCYCAPKTIGVGGRAGYHNEIDGMIGGQAKITHDGLAFDTKANGIAGASWKPKVYAGGYANYGDKIITGEGSLGGAIANYWQPRLHTALGIHSNGNIPLAFEPGSNLINDGYIDPRAQMSFGEDGWKRAALYGAGPPPMAGL